MKIDVTHLRDGSGVEDHCPSCHDDVEMGYTYYDDFYDYDDDIDEEIPPEEFRFCCCAQQRLADEQGLRRHSK